MERKIIKIDDDLCNGCGLCIPNCHEGALQIIDGKVRLVSELMCDGLGACIGHCPEGAITIERREAAPYDEVLTVKGMIPQGKNTIIAHFRHMVDHHQEEYLQQGLDYLESVRDNLPFDMNEVREAIFKTTENNTPQKHSENKCNPSVEACGCSGSIPIDLTSIVTAPPSTGKHEELNSALSHWPVQLHLVNPASPNFKKSDLLIAADCAGFAVGNFHTAYLKGKTLVIACPKLDSGKDIYVEKFRRLIDEAEINTITVMMMEVSCCGGLLQLVQAAQARASRKIPVKMLIMSIHGELLKETWI